MRRHKLKDIDTPQHKSAITNGSRVLDGIDGRSASARRIKDIIRDLANDLGGVENLTTTQMLLVRSTAGLVVRRELHDAAMVNGEPDDLDDYLKIANAERRHLISLGLKRVRRDATPDLHEYLNQRKRNGHARPSNRIRVDRMESDG